MTVAVVGTATLAGWFARIVAHLADSKGVDHAAGTWTALALYANRGTLYPPLYEHGFFGGTRYMPVPILLHAGAARLSGEYLVSGKVVAGVSGAVLFGTLLFILRWAGCPLPQSLVLVGAVAASGTAIAVTGTIRGDLLPVILQLLAVWLVARSNDRKALVASGVLCALAVLSKLSAVWALLAVAAWLLVRVPRRLPLFLGSFAAPLVAAGVVLETETRGRFTQNVLGLLFAGSGGFGSFSAEVDRLRLIVREGPGLFALVIVVAALVVLRAAWRRRLTLYQLALACAALVLAVVLTDRGAYVNHTIDVEALAAVVAGETFVRASGTPRARVAAVSLVVVAAVACIGSWQNLELRGSVTALVHLRVADSGFPRVPLAGVIGRDDEILSENPYLDVARGRLPVVLDPFTVRVLVRDHPAWRRDLVRRLDAQEFDEVVLLYRPDSAPYWYSQLHFGRTIVNAIERDYRPLRGISDYWIYERRRRP